MTEKLAIFINQKHLGSLTLDGLNDRYGLVYDQDWSDKSGFSISPHLKQGDCKSNTVKRFLANLLPEGKWLEELSVNCQISKSNVFGLIAAIGLETTGALSFRQQNEKNDNIPTSFRVVSSDELQDRLSRRQQLSIATWDGISRLSVAGIQDKLPILIGPDGKMGFGEGALASTHILKFGTKPEMHLVVNEFICMKLAGMAKLPVAPVSIDRYGEPVLIVERFDRRWSSGRVKRLHLIDGCQLLDLPPTYKYERPFGKSGEGANIRTGANLPALFAACQLCRIPALAMRDLLHWVLLQLLIGNSDAHGKNISFYVGRGGIDVAPAYDLVNIEVYGDQYERDMAMAVGDTFEFDGIHAYQLADMAEECGLSQRQVATSLRSLCITLMKAVDSFDLKTTLVGDEYEFGQKVLDSVKANCQRFLVVAKELPDVQL